MEAQINLPTGRAEYAVGLVGDDADKLHDGVEHVDHGRGHVVSALSRLCVEIHVLGKLRGIQ